MLKNKKGLSLTTMVITVFIMIVIMGTLVYSAVDSVKSRKLNKLYNDLRQLSDAVEVYYLKNGKLPINTAKSGNTIVINGRITGENERSGDTKEEVAAKNMEFVIKSNVTEVIDQNSFINPNDYDKNAKSATYQFIDLKLLTNLSLNYPSNEYIVNTQSHTIYNYTGVVINKAKYNALPLEYRDIKYIEEHDVKTVGLKAISGVTSGDNLYLAYSLNSLNLRDCLVFNHSGSDGLGQPKSVTYAWTDPEAEHPYFDLNTATGVLTKKGSGNVIEEPHQSSVTITTNNYDGTTITKEIIVHSVSIDILKTLSPEEALTSVNLAATHSESMYVSSKTTSEAYLVQRYGTLIAEDTSITMNATSEDNNIATGLYDKTEGKVTYTSGTKAGTANVTLETASKGKATDTVQVNVYDFKICPTGSNTSLTSLDFSGIGNPSKKTIKLNVELPTAINSSLFSMNNTGNAVAWSLVTDGTGATADTSGVAKIDTTSNNDTIEVTPLKTGTTYLKCVYTVSDEVLGTIVMPINVYGSLTATGATLTNTGTENTIALKGNTKTVTLNYSLTSAAKPSGSTVKYTYSSSNANFKVPDTSNTNSTGQFAVTYDGSAATSTNITITATVTKDGVETTYTEKVTITYSST